MNDIQSLETFEHDPVLHVEEIQGVGTLMSYQKTILEAIRDNDRVVIRSCHDMGKTFTMAKAILWFVPTFENSKTITTAPTFNQVKMLLWSEVRAGWEKAVMPIGGEMLQTEWKLGSEWFAKGFTSKTEVVGGDGQGTASSFQGFHAPYILVIFDEATGISRQIWIQAEGLMTSHRVKFVAIGNPTSKQSEFFKCFQDPAWKKIKISCFDSPNLIASNIKHVADLEDEINAHKGLSDNEAQKRLNSYKVVQPQLLTTKAVIAAGLKWGLKHPLFVSKFLGDFPEEDDNVLITLGMVEKSQYRWAEAKNLINPTTRVIGVDCARYGPDKTVIVMLEDHVMKKRVVLPKSSITEIVGHVTKMMMSTVHTSREEILVDGTGLGAGVVDGLIENQTNGSLRRSVSIKEIHFGSTCESDEDKQHYLNLKAKMYKLLSDSMKTDLALMPEQVYLEELPTILYKFTPKGQLAIESKDDYKKRTGMGSPDDSDALALANYGRVDTSNAGEWVDTMKTSNTYRKPFASGIKSGDHW